MSYYLGIIPARKKTKRLPGKNLKSLLGKPLIAYTIESALKSESLNKIIVSTDDEKTVKIAKKFGADVPFLRPQELAEYNTSMLDVVKHATDFLEKKGYKFDAIVILPPTSPLRNHYHIKKAIQLFERSKADTLTAVYESKLHPYWYWKVKKEYLITYFDKKKFLLERHELPKALVENGSILVVKRKILESNTLYGDKVVPYIMPEKFSVDIDTIEDFIFSKIIIKQKNG